jgi:hypothetical protein
MRRSFKGNTIDQLAVCIKTWCPLGESHFCDGTPNFSQTKLTSRVKPCEYFVKGHCTEPHIYFCGRKGNE